MTNLPAGSTARHSGAFTLLLLLAPAATHVQWPPDSLTNSSTRVVTTARCLQVLPKEIAVRDLVPIMAGLGGRPNVIR